MAYLVARRYLPVIFALCALGCGTSPKARPVKAPAPLVLASVWDRARPNLPSGQAATLIFDLDWLRRLADQGALGRGEPAQQLSGQLDGLFVSRYGLSLNQAKAIVVAVMPDGALAAWIDGPVDTARLNMRLVMMRGRTVYELKRPGQAAAWLIAGREGRAYTVFSDASLAKAWLDSASTSPTPTPWLAASVLKRTSSPVQLVGRLEPAQLKSWLGAPFEAPVQLVAGLSDEGIELHMLADAALLARAEALLSVLKAQLLKSAQGLRTRAQDSPLTDAALLTAQAHWAERVVSLLAPTKTDRALTLWLPPLWRTETLPTLSLLASLIQESYAQAEATARTALAQRRLDQLQGAVEGYVLAHQHKDAAGQWQCALPPALGPTPSQKSCCATLGGPADDSGALCSAQPDRWRQAGWDQLGFLLAEPDPFVYTLEVGAGQVTLTLRGDSDCDSVLSTYRAVVTVKAGPQGCIVERGPALWRNTKEDD